MIQSERDSPRITRERVQSTSSTRLRRTLQSARTRRELARGTSSAIQQRRDIRVVEDGIDLTPKSLSHRFYPSIDEKQLTAFDTIGTSQSSMTHLAVGSAGHGGYGTSSMNLARSSSIQLNVLPVEEMDSILSARSGVGSLHDFETDTAPSQFCLPRYDSSIFHVKPDVVKLTIKETETFFLFEMPQLTADLETPEGQEVKEANERYNYITSGAGSNRKLVNADTQTPKIHVKPRSTYVGHEKRHNRANFVNNWVMHDTYAAIESMVQEDKRCIVHLEDAISPIVKPQERSHKFSQHESELENCSFDDQLARIYEKINFSDAVRVMERIIASSLYITAQKRFKSLIRKDPLSLDLEFTYSLDLLWTHACSLTRDRKVSCFRWNPTNTSLLAAGYGSSNTEQNGLLLIWCVKNPSQPERIYPFQSPISDASWSTKKPNQLAIGFYDGSINVIDVSKKDVVIVRKSSRLTSPSYSPHWQVQWWIEDERYNYLEQIYTSNQDGRIMCYRTGEDFVSSEIMRISRIEGEIEGIKRNKYCNIYEIPISRNPGALLLRRHPNSSTIYLVGTDEGCVHRCSTNYLHQHIDSLLVHDGPVYSLEYSPFCSKIFLTCGADWCTRIWADGISEPLITLSTQMACVRGAVWCPTNSTVIASIVNNDICIWDIKRKTYRPTSITSSFNNYRFVMLDFTDNGRQLLAADVKGDIHVYSLEGMPFSPFDQTGLLVKSIEKALVTKPGLLRKLKKVGFPF